MSSTAFKPGKYTRWYFAIIDRARQEPRLVGENHHIIPKSIGGSNRKANIVRLTYREHLLCHWLLTRMVDGEAYHKMCHAFRMMVDSKRSSMRVPLHVVAEARRGHALAVSAKMKAIERSPEWIEKTRIHVQQLAEAQRGKKRPEHAERMRQLMKEGRLKRVPGAKKGGSHHMAKGIVIDGVTFATQSDAAKHYGITVQGVSYRVKSPNFPTWVAHE